MAKKRSKPIAVGRYVRVKAAWAQMYNKQLNIDVLVGADNHGRELWAQVINSSKKKHYNLQLVALPTPDGHLADVPRKHCGETVVIELPDMPAPLPAPGAPPAPAAVLRAETGSVPAPTAPTATPTTVPVPVLAARSGASLNCHMPTIGGTAGTHAGLVAPSVPAVNAPTEASAVQAAHAAAAALADVDVTPIGGTVTVKGIEWLRVEEASLRGAGDNVPDMKPEDLNWDVDLGKLSAEDRDEWIKVWDILYPGNLDHEVKLMNEAARDVRLLNWDEDRFKDVTRDELRMFHLYHPLAACFRQKGVENLWRTVKVGIREPAALGKYGIGRERFKDMRALLPFSIASDKREWYKTKKTWAMVTPWTENMNRKRLDLLGMNRAGDPTTSAKNLHKKKFKICMDELMFAFQAAHSWAGSHERTGGAPNLVCENRKPDPIGFMWKNAVMAGPDMTLSTEPVGGADKTEGLEYFHERGVFGDKIKATPACVARLCKNYTNCTVAGDAWFAGLRTNVRQRLKEKQDSCGPVKTNKAGLPLAEASACVTGKSRGAKAVFTATVDGVDVALVAYLFSHSAKPVMLLTNFGSTRNGKLYHPKFQDEFGNISEADVPRPDIITEYFKINTIIDDRNHVRQHSLQIERKLPTTCAFTKCITGMLGETIVDLLRLTKWLSVFDFDQRFEESTEFVDWFMGLFFLEDQTEMARLNGQRTVVDKDSGKRYTLQLLPYTAKCRKQKQLSCAACAARSPKASVPADTVSTTASRGGRKAKRQKTNSALPSGARSQVKKRRRKYTYTRFCCPLCTTRQVGICDTIKNPACFTEHLSTVHGIEVLK